MKQADLHWLAGFLEGEGCFTVVRTRGRYVYPRVKVATTDRDVVERAARLIDRTVRRIRPRFTHHKPQYETSIAGAPAVRLMRQLHPLMGRRRKARILSLVRRAA